MNLTRDNYHSLEANREYMSWHQFLGFMTCEAHAMASLTTPMFQESNALILGTLLHAWNESEEEYQNVMNQYSNKVFKKNGEYYSEFKFLPEMIETLEKSSLCMNALAGEKETIMTGEFAGMKWKIRIDSFNRECYRFADLKSAISLNQKMDNPFTKRRESFISARGYVGQLGIYGEVIRQNMGFDFLPEPFLVIATKESPPDKAVVSFDAGSLTRQLEWIEENAPRVIAVKTGQIEPIGCGGCSYCRKSKTLTGTIHYSDL